MIFTASTAIGGLDDPVNDTCIPADCDEAITIESEVSDEAAAPKAAPDPGQPTKEQLDRHRLTHTVSYTHLTLPTKRIV